MSEPRTPQVPMVDGNGEPFYPLTQYNQIVMPDGNRWDGKGGGAQIDDTSASTEKVYSSQKVEAIASQLSEQKADKDGVLRTDPAEDESAEAPEMAGVPINADQLGGRAAADYALKTDTAPDSEKLGGKQPDYYTFNDVKFAAGHLVNSGNSPVEGHGVANVILRPNGIAEIHYSVQITTAGSEGTVFDWGLNTYAIQQKGVGIPHITPVGGGCCTYYSGTGLSNENIGFAGTHNVSREFWQFARMYEIGGSIGGWTPNQFQQGDRIQGVCFGTYER